MNDDLLKALLSHQKEIKVLSINRPSHSVVLKCNAVYIKNNLIGLKEIIFVDEWKSPRSETNIIGYDRSFHGINAVDYLLPGANGKNIVAGVKEQTMDEADIDLWKRVLPSSIAAPNKTYHSTVIASIIGGAGNSFYDGRGIAWGCQFFPSSFSNLFADDAVVLNVNKVTVQNHSYGTVIQQFYGAEAVSYDALAWNDKKFVPVMSAGNSGESVATDGKYANLSGFANLTGNFKMAKNIITVAAIDNKENIPEQSSAGPLYDGRIAPQLTALGPNGTSDAAAVVTGTVAVLQQVFADSNNDVLPPSSLVKAILYNTAEDIYRKGIDYKTGYGLLNSYEAIKAIQQKKWDGSTLSNGQEWKKNISVPANAAELKITLTWTDTVATVNNNKAIVNDLDLEVKEVNSGTIYQPWVLNTASHVDSLAKLPTRKGDSLNTAEQVSIQLPVAGDYEIKVKATSLSAASLPFYIAYNTDTLNTFHFTSPQHASDVNRSEKENMTIRWRTFVADTNQTGSLSISYDNATTWQVIQSSARLASRKYEWPLKDTNAAAVLKMETSFGSFLSNPFIISKITRLQVDFSCADSFRLSWNSHVYANAYKIFALTDSAYLKSVLTVSDTFAVLQKFVYPYLIYAVEPVLSNNVPAARSASLNINLQGVKCFYRTLNYVLLDENKLNLQLELSVAGYADSVFFEKVTASGQLLQTYGGTNATNNTLIYSQLVNEVSGGITYLRGRIKLKNGEIVYTDIIPVLTSGSKNVWIYPNPAPANATVSYVLRQGVSVDSRLQLFDATGRLLKFYASMPDRINLSGFAPGVIIYKLVDSNDKILETGKLVITN
ncbi:MAG: T9SS type A sorting domain-containing protein [Chitinophagaceae bacterium]|nr:MAG: T9SS type A sorting domain-containing protein [Chitinophagaceae bacterium]